MNPQIPCIHEGYQNKLLGAVSRMDYIGDLITRPAATQANWLKRDELGITAFPSLHAAIVASDLRNNSSQSAQPTDSFVFARY